MRALFAALLIFASSLAPAAGGADPFGFQASGPDFLPVEEAYRLDIEVQADNSLRLYWQIADAYYLYQHRFAFSLRDGSGDIPLDVQLPPALEHTDEYFGDVRVYYTDVDLTLVPGRKPEVAQLSVSSQGCADAGLCYPPRTQLFRVDFASGAVSEQALTNSVISANAGQPANDPLNIGTLAYMLVLAFIGGAILNLMPCVFPILSLKVLSFTRGPEHDHRTHAWYYALGVVASFVLVAGVLILLQQAGNAIGWGFQLQSPGFVIALAYLFVAMGLALSGVVQLGGGLMNLGGGLAAREGNAGSFFTGVLAVVVASPCTAPFMGTALGFAITQTPAIGLLVFAALGAGMAAPLVLLAYSDLARRIMPRPGAWMETIKEVLAFPLYATAIWLLWVAGRQAGVDTMAVALAGALMLALGLWLWNRGGWRRALALGCIALAIGMGAWRAPGNGAVDQSVEGTVAWSEQAIEDLRRAGQPVFVDVTADWCITCIANEQAVLFTDEMRAAFAEHGVVYMIADWTNYDPAIARFIEGHGRTGIPLYLMYPADSGAAPLILPQILSRATVLEALQAVSVKNSDVAATF